jgi:hypothetical protein
LLPHPLRLPAAHSLRSNSAAAHCPKRSPVRRSLRLVGHDLLPLLTGRRLAADAPPLSAEPALDSSSRVLAGGQRPSSPISLLRACVRLLVGRGTPRGSWRVTIFSPTSCCSSPLRRTALLPSAVLLFSPVPIRTEDGAKRRCQPSRRSPAPICTESECCCVVAFLRSCSM